MRKAPLKAALCGLVPGDSAKLGTTLQILEALIRLHNNSLLNELKEDFDFFAPFTGAAVRAGVSDEELARRERRLLGNFLHILVRANFRPLKAAEYGRAVEHHYVFDVPIAVDWKEHDTDLLDGFFAHVESPEGRALADRLGVRAGTLRESLGLPEVLARHALVFTRGVGIDRTEGIFFFGKLDRLASLFGFVFWPLQWLVELVRGRPDRRPERAEAPPPSTGACRWVRRANLQGEPLRPASFVTRSKLQEPTFERMIAIFRLRPPVPVPWWTDGWPGLGWIWVKLRGLVRPPGRDWTIHAKLFRDIPMADSEIVFPAKTIRMKSYDVAVLIATAVSGIVALFQALKQHQSSALALAIVGALLAYAAKLFTGYRAVRQAYTARMTHDLYFKNLDNSLGVVQYLVDAFEEQEWKEAAIAYSILVAARGPLSVSELDERAEVFVREHSSGIDVDFEIEDALRKLVLPDGPYPIVECITADGERRYRAFPPEEATKILDGIVDGIFVTPGVPQAKKLD